MTLNIGIEAANRVNKAGINQCLCWNPVRVHLLLSLSPKRALSPYRVTRSFTSTLRLTERHVISSNDVFLLLSCNTGILKY